MKKEYVTPQTELLLLLSKEDILLGSENEGAAMEDNFENMFQ